MLYYTSLFCSQYINVVISKEHCCISVFSCTVLLRHIDNTTTKLQPYSPTKLQPYWFRIRSANTLTFANAKKTKKWIRWDHMHWTEQSEVPWHTKIFWFMRNVVYHSTFPRVNWFIRRNQTCNCQSRKTDLSELELFKHDTKSLMRENHYWIFHSPSSINIWKPIHLKDQTTDNRYNSS